VADARSGLLTEFGGVETNSGRGPRRFGAGSRRVWEV